MKIIEHLELMNGEKKARLADLRKLLIHVNNENDNEMDKLE